MMKMLRALTAPPIGGKLLLATAALTAVAGLALFCETADDQAEADGQASDWRILRALRKGGAPSDPIGPAWLTVAAEEVSALGGVAPISALAVAVSGGLWLGRRRKAAALVAISWAGALVLSEGLKRVFKRQRPPKAYQVGVGSNASFPSGHTLLSSVAYFTVGAVLARALTSIRMKTYVVGASIVTALGVGMTRVYLGLHWANDVVGAWGLGSAWAMLCWMMLGEPPRPTWRQRLPPFHCRSPHP